MPLLTTALVAGGLLVLLRRRRLPPGVTIAGYTPTNAERSGWIQLGDGPGLDVRSANQAWTTPAVAHVLEVAGLAAQALGGTLRIGAIGQKARGAEFPPHKSHRWGRDADIAYTFTAYPTPPDVAVDPRVVEALTTIAPWIEVVGVNEARLAAFAGAPFKVSPWDGHKQHLHLRLRSELTIEPRSLLARRRVVEEQDD